MLRVGQKVLSLKSIYTIFKKLASKCKTTFKETFSNGGTCVYLLNEDMAMQMIMNSSGSHNIGYKQLLDLN